MSTPGNGSGRYARPPLMAALDVAYWVDLPLEMIESRIGLPRTREDARRDAAEREADRIFYILLRCSYAYPHASPHAVRPRLRKGGFAGWVKALRERIGKGVPPGALDDEEVDTDDDGNPLDLSQKDIAAIGGYRKENVSRGISTLRKRRWLLDGFPFKINPKPPACEAPPNEVISTDNWVVANLVISTDNFPTDSEAGTRAQKWVEDLSTRWRADLKTLRTRYREELRKGCTEYGILINKKQRSKSKETTTTGAPASKAPASNGKTAAQPENAAAAVPNDDPVTLAFRPIGRITPAAIRQFIDHCRKVNPKATLDQIAREVTAKYRELARQRNITNPIGVILKIVPLLLADIEEESVTRPGPLNVDRLRELYNRLPPEDQPAFEELYQEIDFKAKGTAT
jgi:hypothetical protein